jgi:hypothetical protein
MCRGNAGIYTFFSPSCIIIIPLTLSHVHIHGTLHIFLGESSGETNGRWSCESNEAKPYLYICTYICLLGDGINSFKG